MGRERVAAGWLVRCLCGAVLLVSLLVTGLAPASAAGRGGTAGCGGYPGVQRALDVLTGTYGMAGAAAEDDDPACGRWRAASGVADVRTGRPMRADQRIRIGSTTKAFTATVVLQLAA